MPATHAVENQATPLAGHDLFGSDRALVDALRLHAPALDTTALSALGLLCGSAAMQEHARLANVHKPVLHTHDRVGRRIDEVEFHPSYHALLGAAVEAGLHAAPWGQGDGVHPEGEGTRSGAHLEREGTRSGAHLERAVGFLIFTQLEPSVLCPVSMTYAVAPALRGNPAIATEWLPRLTARRYDPRLAPIAAKHGATMGMGMTEKQGGSDVRANTTRAEYLEDTPWGRCYRLTGHKWFFSAPMSDAFLVLAQTSAGLGCFFLPRVLPDGFGNGAGNIGRNAIAIQRLKDKLGNHANASSEVEFDGALAWLVGDEGRGVAQILEMGTLTRLDCALGTAGLMRAAVSIALHHCNERRAFGKLLNDQPLMTNVLADLALESEAATALALRLARAIDRPGDPFEVLMRRVLTPVAKFWVCKRGAALAQEAMECLGGNGYVEAQGEGTMARIYREMPLNSIWEGAGNIMALDLLRALRKRGGREADGVQALATEMATTRGASALLDHHADALLQRLDDPPEGGADEAGARRIAQDIVLAMQASLLRRHSTDAVFDAFCRSRLDGATPTVFGTLPAGLALEAIVARAMPA